MKNQLICHCKKIVIEINIDRDYLRNIRRCDCSLCNRKGYVMASVTLDELCIKEGLEHLRLYQWGTGAAEHYFCNNCGVYTHHKRKSNPNEFGINIACIEGVDAVHIQNVPVGNGDLNLLVEECSRRHFDFKS